MNEEEYGAYLEAHTRAFKQVGSTLGELGQLVARRDAEALKRLHWVDVEKVWNRLRTTTPPAGLEEDHRALLECLAAYRAMWQERKEFADALQVITRFEQALARAQAAMPDMARLQPGTDAGEGGPSE